jgi:predicted nucleotidyltransferase
VEPALTKTEVLERIASQGAAIRSAAVNRLGHFGSFLRAPSATSDVDLLVEFEPARKTFDNFWKLSELLEGELSRPVDLLTIEGLSPYIGPKILAEVEYVSLGQ